MTQSPGNSSAQILTFGPIPMTHPAKTPPDALLPQIYCIISPLTETGEEAECLNFSLVIQAEIAVELDMQVQNVSRAIKELFEQGIIVKGPKNGRYCSYKLNPNMVRLRN